VTETLLEADGLRKSFPVAGGSLLGRRRVLRAVDGVSLTLRRGEVVGVVGESGCGKSTFGRLLLRLVEPTAGSLRFRGKNMLGVDAHELLELRRHIQMVFQDPVGSLNPRMTVGRALMDVLRFHRIGGVAERRRRAFSALDVIGLGAGYFARYPHELSGGQSQRVAIARALILRPDLVVLDEPVSALDVSIRAQILQLVLDLRREFDLTYVFISHDIGVVQRISDRIAVFYLGKIVEIADAKALSASPLHPYSRALLQAALVADPRVNRVANLTTIEGDPPSPVDPPSGCRFHTRCPLAEPRCAHQEPPLFQVAADRAVACFLHEAKSAATA
jgi:oligopeptide transport system ATP-binding protein